MTALVFVLAALVVGAVGIALGIIVAPILTRAAERMATDQRGEAPSRDDERG
jgi:ABC-type lipoprotein release transport system permease subunit